jgi:hypothetical protein
MGCLNVIGTIGAESDVHEKYSRNVLCTTNNYQKNCLNDVTLLDCKNSEAKGVLHE